MSLVQRMRGSAEELPHSELLLKSRPLQNIQSVFEILSLARTVLTAA